MVFPQNLPDYFHQDIGFTGAWRPLDQSNILRLQRFPDRALLGKIQLFIIEAGHSLELEIPGLLGTHKNALQISAVSGFRSAEFLQCCLLAAVLLDLFAVIQTDRTIVWQPGLPGCGLDSHHSAVLPVFPEGTDLCQNWLLFETPTLLKNKQGILAERLIRHAVRIQPEQEHPVFIADTCVVQPDSILRRVCNHSLDEFPPDTVLCVVFPVDIFLRVDIRLKISNPVA